MLGIVMQNFFKHHRTLCIIVAVACLCAIAFFIFNWTDALSGSYSVKPGDSNATGTDSAEASANQVKGQTASAPALSPLDIAAYNAKLIQLANANPSSTMIVATSSAAGPSFTVVSAQRIALPKVTGATTTRLAPSAPTSTTVFKTPLWPVGTVYPEAGALLPANRIVAYYGNFYSTQMGVLGEYPPPQMLQMLKDAVAQWQAADPTTPVIPALDYIAVTAQGSAGPDGKYRDRMPASQINEAIQLASQVNGLVFLDVQVGLSNLQTEVPLLEPYLKLPNVELSVDPEFSMKDGAPPGTEIGTFDSSDINFAANYLAALVKQYNLPPKILVVHRFTQDMVTNYKEIMPLPQVQVVMDMDGWGQPAKKITTYTDFIEDEPVQFTGFKLFYKADLRPPSTMMMTPEQVLKLTPQPSYVQYQ